MAIQGSTVIASNIDAALLLQPLPAGYAYVEITEDGDSDFKTGDVARVNLKQVRFVADGVYAIQSGEAQVIRRIQARSDGLHLFWGASTQQFDQDCMSIIGMVDSRFSLERMT